MRDLYRPKIKKTWKSFSLVFFLLLLPAISCRNLLDKLNEAASPKEKTLKNERKNIQLTIPKGWREDKSLNEQADLQASNRLQENYIMVLSESKRDFDNITALKHSQITSGALINNLKKSEVSPLRKIQVGGKNAYQYVIRGVFENIKLTYLHTTVDGADDFHQIMAWTLQSRFPENEAILQKVTDSFREPRKKGAAE